MSRTLGMFFAASLAVAPLAGCVVYEPYPGYYYPGGNNFDRAWSAALGGTQDAGVQVSAALQSLPGYFNNAPFVPPKPKEFESTYWTFFWRAVFGT